MISFSYTYGIGCTYNRRLLKLNLYFFVGEGGLSLIFFSLWKMLKWCDSKLCGYNNLFLNGIILCKYPCAGWSCRWWHTCYSGESKTPPACYAGKSESSHCFYYSWFWVTDWEFLQMNTGLVDTRKRQSMVWTEAWGIQFQAATGAACIFVLLMNFEDLKQRRQEKGYGTFTYPRGLQTVYVYLVFLQPGEKG